MTAPARVVLITGASSGIGRATAHRLAGRGDHLVLVARSEQPLRDTALECEAAGAGSTLVITADVAVQKDVDEAVSTTLARHGRLDAVVQSAGVVGYGDFLDIPAPVFDAVLATNVIGSANVSRSALRVMHDQGHGSLVLLSSVIGYIAVPRMSPYVISKWAVRALARELQLENRDRAHIHISCISPGSVDTPIYLQGATYAGAVGRPPPPVISPERVASSIESTLNRPRHTVHVGPVNRIMQLGFSLTPKLYDVLIGPLAGVATLEASPTEPTTGNVLEPQPTLDRLHGEQGSSVIAVARVLASRLLDLTRRR